MSNDDRDLTMAGTSKLDQIRALAFHCLEDLCAEQTKFVVTYFEAGHIDATAIMKSLPSAGRRSMLQLLHVLAEVTFMEYCVDKIRTAAQEKTDGQC